MSPTSAASPSPAPEEQDQDVASKKREAQARFQKGLEYYAKEAWDAALTEFVLSRATYPTRAATKNAAFCLRNLRRFDEAFGMFEELLRFANLSEADRSLAQGAIAELALGLGALRIEGAAEGATLVVDGRYRGTLPLPEPLRVSAGAHEVRAFREGLDLFGATVEVFAEQEATVTLRSLSTGGRLRLTEQRGRVLDVVIDGNVVGKTPWDGSLAVGEHLVTLRGSVNLDAMPECAAGEQIAAGRRAASLGKVELGTQPVSVPIRLREATQLTLTAEPLDTLLRIEPMPGGASVVIDSVVVGRGIWEGRLRVGNHKVEVMAEGFETEMRRVTLLPHQRELLSIELERSVQAPGSHLARNVGAGASYGVGALGLGTFAVASILAKGRVDDLKAACPNNHCPPTEQGRLDAVRTLETVSTHHGPGRRRGRRRGGDDTPPRCTFGRAKSTSESGALPRRGSGTLRASRELLMRDTASRRARSGAAFAAGLASWLLALSCGQILGSSDLEIGACNDGARRCTGNTP